MLQPRSSTLAADVVGFTVLGLGFRVLQSGYSQGLLGDQSANSIDTKMRKAKCRRFGGNDGVVVY